MKELISYEFNIDTDNCGENCNSRHYRKIKFSTLRLKKQGTEKHLAF